jgi:hypothetical protein
LNPPLIFRVIVAMSFLSAKAFNPPSVHSWRADFLADVLDAVGETKGTILSAYRTAETNAMLARTTFGVAENSQDIVNRALDVRLEAKLSDAMTKARASVVRTRIRNGSRTRSVPADRIRRSRLPSGRAGIPLPCAHRCGQTQSLPRSSG